MVWLAAVGVWMPARAAEDRFVELRGAYLPGAKGNTLQMVARARLTFESAVRDHWTLVSTVEAALQHGRNLATEVERTLRESDFGPLLEGCTFSEAINPWLGVSSADDYLDVDRLYADYYSEQFDLRVGRQAIFWGSAQFINPTDPFFQFLLAEPWRPRQGINAARVTVPFGPLDDVTVVVGMNDTFDGARVAGRAQVNFWETDWALVGAYRSETQQGLVGVDLKGTFGVGWWIEAAIKLGDRNYEEMAVGIDYSFPVLENIVVTAQYYRNGSGTRDSSHGVGGGATSVFGLLEPPECDVPNPYLTAFIEETGRSRPDPFASFTVGTDYVLLSVSAGITPDVNASLSGLQNLHDGTALFIPTLNTHPIEWMDLALSAQIPAAVWGTGGEFKPRASDLVIAVPGPEGSALAVDLSGLVPSATLTLWMRGNF